MSSTTPMPLNDVGLPPGSPPLVHALPTGDPQSWAAEHRDRLRALVFEHGSVRVRGIGLDDADKVGQAFRGLAGELITEMESFAPRRRLPGGVYSATAWPARQQMCMHHELSHTLDPPGLLLFACLVAPADGGATGLADSAAVLRALPDDLVRRFEREGWLLTRSYNDEIGASALEAFGTDDRAAIERYCRSQAIEFEWRPDGGLRTWQRRNAVARHPVTGHRCWFNQIAFLNEWTLEREVRDFLIEEYGAGGLPFNTFFGNGDPIGEDVVQLLNQTYTDHTRREPWRAGDLLLVDNVRTAHSREPYDGPREVLAGLAAPIRLETS